LIQVFLPSIDQLLDFFQLVSVSPNAAAFGTFVQDNSAGVPIIEMLHADGRAIGTVQLIVVILFGGKILLIDSVYGGNLGLGKYFRVVFDKFQQFAGVQPFAVAIRAGFYLNFIVFS
jgi:hypothetical protein